MSTTLACKELYIENEAYWDCFTKVGGFSELTKGYLAHRVEQFLAKKLTLPKEKSIEGHEVRKCALVFIDGLFAAELSHLPEGALVLPLSEAKKSYDSFIAAREKRLLAKEKSALFALNGALAREPAFVYLSPNTIIKEPVEIVQLSTSESSHCLHTPKLQMVLGKGSQIKLVREQRGLCVNQALDLQLEEGAYLELITLTESEGTLFDSLRVCVKEKSNFTSTIVSKGAPLVLRDYHIELAGEGAEAKVAAALSLGEKREEQIEIMMEHIAPNCISDQHIKEVGYRASRHSFSGTIYVHKTAKDTESYQKHSALLLDETAFVAQAPNLEIFADEVKASHGATTGQLDLESLLYLRSRGLSVSEAEKLLIKAHLQEITDSIPTAMLRMRAKKLVE